MFHGANLSNRPPTRYGVLPYFCPPPSSVIAARATPPTITNCCWLNEWVGFNPMAHLPRARHGSPVRGPISGHPAFPNPGIALINI